MEEYKQGDWYFTHLGHLSRVLRKNRDHDGHGDWYITFDNGQTSYSNNVRKAKYHEIPEEFRKLLEPIYEIY